MNLLEEDRFESRFDQLPLIGKIPKYIRGKILKTELGDINLDERNNMFPNILKWGNFFKKLKWYEKRIFDIKKVKCVETYYQNSIKIEKDQIYDVDYIEFYFSPGLGDYVYDIALFIYEHRKFSKECPARYFIPIEYEILTDETL